MGFFAILNDPDHPSSTFTVRKCHVNFWALSGILGRRNYFWDVGLHLKIGPSQFQRFQIAIPSGTGSDLTDLHDKMIDQQIAEMIFGKPVQVGANQIEYEDSWLQLPRLSSADSKPVVNQSNRNFTLWTLQTTYPIEPDSDIYLRVRFAVSSVGRSWNWKRFWLARCGALVDVRFADLREAWSVPKGNELKDRILPIEQLNFFVVAPANFHLLVTSPPVHYIRILEGRAWEKYLNRKTNLFSSEKLCIYQWRSEKEIKTDQPLRVFLQMQSQLGGLSTANLLLCSVVLLLLSALGVMLSPHLKAMTGTLSIISSFVRAHLIGFGISSAISIILILLNTSDEFVRRVKWLGPKFDRCEQWLMSVGRNS